LHDPDGSGFDFDKPHVAVRTDASRFRTAVATDGPGFNYCRIGFDDRNRARLAFRDVRRAVRTNCNAAVAAVARYRYFPYGLRLAFCAKKGRDNAIANDRASEKTGARVIESPSGNHVGDYWCVQEFLIRHQKDKKRTNAIAAPIPE
jgi:hypothetical protein